jgi:hypothetical protein
MQAAGEKPMYIRQRSLCIEALTGVAAAASARDRGRRAVTAGRRRERATEGVGQVVDTPAAKS